MLSGKEWFILFCKERLGRLIGNLLAAGFILVTLWLFLQCGRSPSPALAVSFFLLSTGSAAAAALLLAVLYLPSVTSGITSFLLFPKSYLKKAPVSLSPVQGMIATGDFERAEIQLQDILRRFPDHTAAALMLLEFYADTVGDPFRAADTAEKYLDSKPARPEPLLHFRLLMRYADLLQGTGKEPELKERLSLELKRGRLSRSRASALKTRLNALQTH